MGTKKISLRAVYERLASLKREEESFSDVVERLIKDRVPKYSDITGLLSEETISAIEKVRKERKQVDKVKFQMMASRFRGNQE
ncbi:MAG: antitoxin VapB family protein [Thermoproteota archaeon]